MRNSVSKACGTSEVPTANDMWDTSHMRPDVGNDGLRAGVQAATSSPCGPVLINQSSRLSHTQKNSQKVPHQFPRHLGFHAPGSRAGPGSAIVLGIGPHLLDSLPMALGPSSCCLARAGGGTQCSLELAEQNLLSPPFSSKLVCAGTELNL